MNDYLNNLKTTDLRPKKVKIREEKEKILLEDEITPTDTSKDIEDKIEKQKTFPVGGGNPPGVEEDINELFIQHAEIEGMPAGARRDMAIIRISMIAELDASSFYERLAELASNDGVKKVLL